MPASPHHPRNNSRPRDHGDTGKPTQGLHQLIIGTSTYPPAAECCTSALRSCGFDRVAGRRKMAASWGTQVLIVAILMLITGQTLRMGLIRGHSTWLVYATKLNKPQLTEAERTEIATRAAESLARLKKVLEAAALPNRTVIVTALTGVWRPMMDLFLNQLAQGNGTANFRNHLVVLNPDKDGFKYCQQLKLHCYFDSQDDATTKDNYSGGEKAWMTPVYVNMMWRRLELLRKIIHLDYNFLFTDNDVLWFQNPLPHLQSLEDLHVASDEWHPESTRVRVNVGFFFARSNNRTKAFFDYWIHDHARKFPKLNEQDVFMRIRPESNRFTRQTIGISVNYLPTDLFGGVCNMGSDLDSLVTVHSTCCYGLEPKLRVLRMVVADYRAQRSLSDSMRKKLAKHQLRLVWSPRVCTKG